LTARYAGAAPLCGVARGGAWWAGAAAVHGVAAAIAAEGFFAAAAGRVAETGSPCCARHWLSAYTKSSYGIMQRGYHGGRVQRVGTGRKSCYTPAMEAICLYRSPVLPDAGFVHGFPHRTGGVSTGARASLNLGAKWGDDPRNVAENLRRVAAHVGYDPSALQIMRHAHGIAVWQVGTALPEPPEFDGMVCGLPGPVLAAFAADCIPLLLADPVARVCGAAHSGWRGTVGGIAGIMVERTAALGSRPADLRAALGPSIGPCCFEVGPEVVSAFRAAFGELPGMVVAGPHKDHIDLRVVTRHILERAGVAPEHIDSTPPCTRCDERFFSYRRDGQAGGVLMGFIGLIATG
jgi:polyphenol oxidase